MLAVLAVVLTSDFFFFIVVSRAGAMCPLRGHSLLFSSLYLPSVAGCEVCRLEVRPY